MVAHNPPANVSHNKYVLLGVLLGCRREKQTNKLQFLREQVFADMPNDTRPQLKVGRSEGSEKQRCGISCLKRDRK